MGCFLGVLITILLPLHVDGSNTIDGSALKPYQDRRIETYKAIHAVPGRTFGIRIVLRAFRISGGEDPHGDDCTVHIQCQFARF